MKANIPPVGREPNKGLQLHLIRFIVQWDYHGFVFVTTDDVQRKIRLLLRIGEIKRLDYFVMTHTQGCIIWELHKR